MADQQIQGSDCQSWTIGPGGYFKGEGRDRAYVLCHVDGPELREPVEVVPRSEAEALAEALERVAEGAALKPPYHWSGRRVVGEADDALSAYRSRHPKETP